jgi:hypothetical protein
MSNTSGLTAVLLVGLLSATAAAQEPVRAAGVI